MLVGWGIGTATFPALMFQAEARAVLRSDGSGLMETGAHDMGQGAWTALAQIAADGLGLELDQMEFKAGTSDLPDAGIAGGSAHTATAGMAIHHAGAAVIAKLADLATTDQRSPLFGAGNAGVVARGGRLFRRDDEMRSESYADILGRAGLKEIEARGKGAADPASQSTYAMHAHGAVFAEVKVDPDLGQIRVTRLVGAFAAGRIINPHLVRSQIFGGMIWGMSFALHEHAIMDRRSGRTLNPNLAEYHIPVNADVPSPGSHHGRRARSARERARHQGCRRNRHHRLGRRRRQRGLARDRNPGASFSDQDRGSCDTRFKLSDDECVVGDACPTNFATYSLHHTGENACSSGCIGSHRLTPKCR